MHVLPTCLLWLAVQSQVPGAVLTGTVRDAATAAPIAGALVTLGDVDRRTTTDENGRFAFDAVSTGPQHLSAARIGYRARTVHALMPGAGTLAIDIALAPDPVQLARLNATKRRAFPGLEADSGSRHPDREVTSAELNNHPALAEADALRALEGGGVSLAPEAPAGVHVRGGAADHTAYMLDGIPVLSPYHAAGLVGAWNPDALAAVRLESAAPSPALPDALSGVIAATTRTPGPHLRMQSSLSNTQLRTTVDGPATARAGYLLSWRSNLPATMIAKDESSYLRPETGDVLGRITIEGLGSELGVLGYESENELRSAALGGGTSGAPAAQNEFAWRSRSVGAHYRRTHGDVRYGITAWLAQLDAGASWTVGAITSKLAAAHDDGGVAAVVERHGTAGVTHAGIRIARLRSHYDVRSDSTAARFVIDGVTHVATVHAQHAIVAGRVAARAGMALTATETGLHLSPRLRLDANVDPDVTLTLAAARTRQYAQSLRNAESVAGQVFPADLLVASSHDGVREAHADELLAGALWQPGTGIRIGVQAYGRRMQDIVVLAASDVDPFATQRPGVADATARGASLEVAAGGAHYGILAAYDWQRVRMRRYGAGHTPSYATGHLLQAALAVYPTAASSARVAVQAGAGRVATAVDGPFEYESCNILDSGCEFAGSPRLAGAAGAERLPAYVRVDAGARHHWHVRAASRNHLIGVHATITNVFGRRNVLTYATDDETGRREAIEMVPRAPLVIGIDWRF